MQNHDFVSGWRSASSKKTTGVVYGLRFGRLREVLIEGRPSIIQLDLVGHKRIAAGLSKGFWKQCPEVRHPNIGPWMVKQGVSFPWPLGCPPRFRVERVGINIFRISVPTP
jgi:hypothetical protein